MRNLFRNTLALLALAAPVWAGIPGGNLLVTPTRVVLEGCARSAEVILHNAGPAPASYRISLINLEMDEEGRTHEKALEAGRISAEALVRYSPRQVRLAAGASQAVRIQLRKPEQLAPGEYAAHMLFRAIPEAEPQAPAAAAGNHVSMSLRAVFGLSIPVIVRHGALQATPALSGLRLLDPERRFPLRVAFDLEREGDRSLYGDLVFTWQPQEGGPVDAGRMNGVAVYPNLRRRKLQVRLDLAKEMATRPGTLKVKLVEHGTAKTLTEGVLALP